MSIFIAALINIVQINFYKLICLRRRAFVWPCKEGTQLTNRITIFDSRLLWAGDWRAPARAPRQQIEPSAARVEV